LVTEVFREYRKSTPRPEDDCERRRANDMRLAGVERRYGYVRGFAKVKGLRIWSWSGVALEGKALKGEKPMSVTGMKQGRRATRGVSRQEGEKSCRWTAAG